MELTYYCNGEFVKSSDLSVSLYDQAFLYGDGIYEPILVRDREIIFLEQHIGRFLQSAEILGYNLNISEKVVKETVFALLDLNSLDDCMVKLIATRGDCSGYYYEDNYSYPVFIVIMLPPKYFPENIYFMGVSLKTSLLRDVPTYSMNHNIRALNMLNRRINYYEAKKEGFFDALMINVEGYVTQCTGSNIFIINENTIITPDLSCGVYPGVMRDYILDYVAKELNLDVYEGFVLAQNVIKAKECFIASTEIGVVPVISCDGNKIGSGRVGTITKSVQSYFIRWYKKRTI